jgi:hypothetical protein
LSEDIFALIHGLMVLKKQKSFMTAMLGNTTSGGYHSQVKTHFLFYALFKNSF